MADTLVSLEEDANTLKQAQRAANAAAATRRDTMSRYQLGSTQYYATLTAGQQYENATGNTSARARASADTASLFQAMGDPPPCP